MIFSKDIKKMCVHCVHAQDFTTGRVLCDKKGPVSETYKCRHFEYDPLRRQPAPPAKVRLNVSEEDFKL